MTNDINSGCIGINLTRNQDTQDAVSLQFRGARNGTAVSSLVIPAQPELI